MLPKQAVSSRPVMSTFSYFFFIFFAKARSRSKAGKCRAAGKLADFGNMFMTPPGSQHVTLLAQKEEPEQNRAMNKAVRCGVDLINGNILVSIIIFLVFLIKMPR